MMSGCVLHHITFALQIASSTSVADASVADKQIIHAYKPLGLGHKKLIVCFWFPAWLIFLLSGCTTTRFKIVKTLLDVCFVNTLHFCQGAVTFNIKYCSVFALLLCKLK